jgi:tetratricopeptide (TPR) repeat protein
VALNRFAAHPIEGIGADNFAQDYLERRRSYETPRYPHSLELRTLSQTGIVGALLLFGALGAALVAARRATRRAGGFGGAVAVGATMVFVYWLVHGSADWFWEFPGLAGPAFAMLGLACALHPRRLGDAAIPGRMLRGPVPVLAAWLLALIGICTLLAPWGAERDVLNAAGTWSSDRAQAFRTLDNAARLNPLSDRPYLIAGSIALRVGDDRRAARKFAAALRRNDRDAYAVLELGAIASEQGHVVRARRLLGHAVALNPSDPVTRRAQARARAGRRVDVDELNRQIEARARRLVRR